jgi:hypothetical protein
MSDIYIVKDWDLDTYMDTCPRGCKVFALSPMAAYHLDSLPVKYYTLAKYKMFFREKSYFEKLKIFFEGFSEAIFKYYPINIDIPITYHCYTMLRNVLDSYVRNHYIYEQMIEQEKPKNIYYLAYDEEDVIDDELYYKNISVLARIAYVYSGLKQGGFKFHPILLPGSSNIVRPT